MKKELEIYELNLILKSTSAEPGGNDLSYQQEKIQYYTDFLSARGSQVIVKNQGKRSLAYPIKNLSATFETATSVQMIFLGNGELLKQIQKEILRDISVLRAIATKLKDEKYLFAQ